MKYENYSTKYELINSFVNPIVLGAIIIFLLRIFYKKIYKVDSTFLFTQFITYVIL